MLLEDFANSKQRGVTYTKTSIDGTILKKALHFYNKQYRFSADENYLF